MQTNQSLKRKKKPLFWVIVAVAGLLAGALGFYAGYVRTRLAGGAAPVVARGKVPPMPPSPSMKSQSGTSILSGEAPPAETSGPENQFPGQGLREPEPSMAASVAGGPQENVPALTSGKAARSQEKSTDGPLIDSEDDSVQTGSSGFQAPGAGPDDSQPLNAAADERRVPAHAAPDRMPPSDSPAPQSSDLTATEAAPVQTASKPSGPKTAAPYTIQVGAFRTKSNADRQAAQLREKGFDAYLLQQNDKNQRAWYFVRFGGFENFGSADQALTAFREQEHLDGAVMRSNSD